ncbi:cadherin-8 isoform X2 [Hippocampus zosterae]|uniref:cadherin-8 isoform X2 n=1 Tax=Hippocampus zosterae TaxID=109293 RepID=UPI00223E197B|nr:cadherin-8 isoform X2 [Hippocampus zosterae]
MQRRSEEMPTDLWTSLLLLWITLLPCVSMMPLGGAETVAGPDEGQRLLSRAKRGWVWNQMFVLEEFSGPDPILVGRLHTDLDVSGKRIKYVLAGEGAGTIFAINELTGDIHAMKRLDREEKAEYTLTAQVINADTDEPLEPPSEFIIKVQDINDNPPQFIEGPYRAAVAEMSAVGTPVTRVTATDADDPVYGNSAKLVYSILEGQPYFSVDPNSATIKIALHGMDREMREEYLVVIQAKDMGGHMGGLSGTTTVTITLTDINDNPPKFSKNLYEFAIPENLPIGQMGGKVKANDRDVGDNAKSTYNIIEGDEQGVFEIVTDPQTQEGILRLKKALDFESRRTYTLKVEAANVQSDPGGGIGGPFKDTATVKIVVEDADEPPVFSKPIYTLEVNENAPVNTVIGTVGARDPDSSGSQVRYFIDRHTDLERQFNINVDDGKITLAKPLDRETDTWHNITVTATEVRNHSQISRAVVAIRVMDINDNAPEFATEYEAFLCENGKPGQVIQTVSAVDRDDPIQGHYFEYRLVPEMLNNPNFTIKNNQDNSISVLAKHDTFRRQKQEMYFLPIVVTDNGAPPMSSTNTLTIRVCGCSKDGIVQSCNIEAYVLPIGLSMGALIAILACIILLLVVLFVTLRRHKNEPLIIKDDEDVRENIIRYDDEGGGEEDTEAFDIATLQNPDGVNGYLPRKDIKPDLQFMPRAGHHSGPNGVDVDEFINVRLHEADNDPTAPPYDSIQIYGYEGRGSVAGSLSSLETTSSDSDQNYDYLREWGPRFRRLGELYSVGENDRET